MLPFVSVILALVAASCVAYVAWVIIQEASGEDESRDCSESGDSKQSRD